MYKITFQDIIYLRLNKWQAKILKYITKKKSTWGVLKVITKYEIIFFSLPRHKSRENWTRKNGLTIDFGGQNETQNKTKNFHYFTIADNIWENTGK